MTMNRRSWLLGITGALVLGGALVWGNHLRLAHSHDDGVASTKAATSASEPLGPIVWEVGNEYRYSVAWKGQSALDLKAMSGIASAPGRAEGDVDIAGDLVLRVLGREHGDTVIEARMEALTRHVFRVLGQDALSSDEAVRKTFDGQTAFVSVADDGSMRAISTRKDCPPLFTMLIAKVLEQTQVTIPSDGAIAWTSTEPAPNGIATARYDAQGRALSRVRAHYDALTSVPPGACEACSQREISHGTMAIDRRGIVGTLSDEEDFALAMPGRGDVFHATTTFVLSLQGVTTFDSKGIEVDLASLVVHRPGEMPTAAGGEAELLVARVGSWTPELLEGTLSTFVQTGRLPADKMWLSGASALLLLKPELCERLVRDFATLPERGRGLVLDLLTAAGSPRAQAAMRKALVDVMHSESSANLAMLIQRFTHLKKPTVESAAFLSNAYLSARGRGDVHMKTASAAALGATAGHLARNGDVDSARKYSSGFASDLVHAKTVEDKEALLMALGNASMPEQEGAIVALANDPNADVRSQVAASLRDATSPEAHATLVAMVSDASPSAGRAALRAIDAPSIPASDLHAIAVRVTSGATMDSLDGPTIDFFAGHLDDREDAIAAIAYILRRTTDKNLQAKARMVLAQLGIAG